MIDATLKFLQEEVNAYLLLQPGLAPPGMSLVAGAASRMFDNDTSMIEGTMANKAIISLVNVEEDRISRQQEPYTRTPTGILYAQPPVLLNLYVLFIMNMKSHTTALAWLSGVIRFFQHQPAFTPLSHPSLDPRIEKLSVELHTLSFEQSNHLWGMLGGKYLPSVLYKVRQVTVEEAVAMAGGGPIRTIAINDHSQQPVS